jgi:iron complex outermembrane receptor protein
MRNRTKRAWQCYGVICALPLLSVTSHAASGDGAIVELEEVVITGSRLKLKDFESVAPVTVLDRARIDELSASSVADVLKYLPQQPFKRDDGFDATGAQYVQLRGLGLGSTLVLINGRRVVASAANVAFNGFDLNSIPLAAVERIEVLADSASAVYGADAMGGVVNVLLARDAPILTMEASYGAAQGGGEESRASLSSGFRKGDFSALFVADYFQRDKLLGEERDRYANQDFHRYGGADWRSSSAHPANIQSANGANLPGLNSPRAAIRDGASGTSISDFEEGRVNLASLNRYLSIVPVAERKSALARLEYSGSSVTLFGEVLYTDRRSEWEISPSAVFRGLVSADNPFNPFGVDVLVDTTLVGLGARRDVTESELVRTVVGAQGAIGGWSWEVSGLHSTEDALSWFANVSNPVAVAEALAANDPTRALNVFQDGPGGSAELLESLKAVPREDRYTSDSTQASASVTGALLQLPGGEVELAFGAEWRKESMSLVEASIVDADRDVSAGYAEVRIPLTQPSMSIRGFHSLALTLAARLDDYSDFGSTFNTQYGLAWRTTDDWLLRASYGTSFRPPSLFELYAPRVVRPARFMDPARNNEVTDMTSISGGNPDLDPTEGKSLSAGFVYAPTAVPGLRVAANYWSVRLDQRVAAFAAQLLLQNEAQFAHRVQRLAPTPEDIAAGLPGRISQVDISRINYGSLKTSGVDLDLSYSLETRAGQLSPYISATWVNTFETVDLPNTPAYDRISVASALGSIPRWRATAGLQWQRAALGASLAVRYTPPYRDADPVTNQPSGEDVDALYLVDLQGTLNLELLGASSPSWRRGVTISAGVQNAFDEEPPFSVVGFDSGYDPSQGELRQRFAYARLSKRF